MTELHLNGQPITTVIFDLDGTLRYSIPGGDSFMLEKAVKLGVSCTPECLVKTRQWAHRYWASSENLLLDQQTYGKGERAFWENYARRTLESLGADPVQVHELASKLHEHMQAKYRPQDHIPADVVPTIRQIKQAGMKAGLLTNRSDPPTEYLQASGLAAELDFCVVAGYIGSWKPDPEAFYYSMGMAGSVPAETIYVGDNYYADIIGAQRAGMQAVLIDRERIFPEPDCLTICEIGELLGLLGLDHNP
ncbi:MAG: HAD family hydrolase [Anaerolineales bacterium]|nr:HAD family hydrolase [Anaerolineales bacterium]